MKKIRDICETILENFFCLEETYLNIGLLISRFIIIASNKGPSRITNSIVLWIRATTFLKINNSLLNTFHDQSRILMKFESKRNLRDIFNNFLSKEQEKRS